MGAMSSFYPLALVLISYAEPRMTSPTSECSLMTKETHKFGKMLTEEAVEEPKIILKEKTAGSGTSGCSAASLGLISANTGAEEPSSQLAVLKHCNTIQ